MKLESIATPPGAVTAETPQWRHRQPGGRIPDWATNTNAVDGAAVAPNALRDRTLISARDS
jgi:hypothetical protein